MRNRPDQWTRWCFVALAEMVLLLACAGGFIVWADPYQIFHKASPDHTILDIRLQRFYVPGLARTADYNTALLGTSMLQNIPNRAVRRICGGRAVNLCLSGASIHEEAAVLALALKHPGTRTVVATLDYNSLSGGSLGKVVGTHEPFPEYLYGGIPGMFPYLLSWDSVSAAFHALRGVPAEGETTDTDWPWKFPASMRFEASQAVAGIDPAHINGSFHMTNLTLEGMEAAFADSIFPVLKANPGVKVHFVFPPYSILVWHDFAQRGQMPVYFAFKKWLIGKEREYRFDLVDFQDRAEIIADMSNYADIYHSAEPIDEQIVAAACRGESLLNETNFATRTESLARLVATTDPAQIVEAARRGGSSAADGHAGAVQP